MRCCHSATGEGGRAQLSICNTRADLSRESFTQDELDVIRKTFAAAAGGSLRLAKDDAEEVAWRLFLKPSQCRGFLFLQPGLDQHRRMRLVQQRDLCSSSFNDMHTS
jgi:hypothetical protein